MTLHDSFQDVDWIAKTPEVGVRVNTLGPGKATAWHYHTHVTDTIFGLDEGLEVALRDPDERVTLQPGQRFDVAARRVHRVVSHADRAIRYLLIQTPGPYDFNEVK